LLLQKGAVFNEMIESYDGATGRLTRRLTVAGEYNHAPTYHYNTAFTQDSRHLVFTTARAGKSAIVSANLETGDIRVLAVADGIGAYYCGTNWGPYSAGSLGGGFCGNHICLAPASNWIVAVIGKRFMAVHHDTLEERVLIDDIGKEYVYGGPGCTSDGKAGVVTYAPEHPDVVAGRWPIKRDYWQALIEEYGGRPTVFVQADIESGEVQEVFREERAGCNHVQPNPVNPDIWLIDRDWPTTEEKRNIARVWVLNVRTKELTEIRPLNEYRFATHSTWNRTGERIYYHGPAKEGGQFVGVADISGRVLWEKVFRGGSVGHVSAHTQHEAILTDGLCSTNLISVMYYEEADAAGAPRIEILGSHNTDWQCMHWQYTHPHCQMSPDGKWVYYNRGSRGRSDVYVVKVAD